MSSCSDASSGDAARPKVSVLVPVYNVEKYLVQCLSSIANQTFDDFEAICINDGSTDGSPAIIEDFMARDGRFRLLDKPNSGYGASMNQGLEAARGVYVAILESDDFFEPDALERLVTLAESAEVDVAKGNFWLYWSAPSERRELFRVVDERQSGRVLRPLEDEAVFFRKPSIWSAIYRRSFLDEQGIRFLETPGASYQDAGFNFKVWAAAKRAAFLQEPVLFYRQDNESSSVKSSAKAYCVCDEYESMTHFIEKRGGADAAHLFGILERMKFDSYMWNIDRLDASLVSDFCDRASREFSRDLELGRVDFSVFEPGAKADLLYLVKDSRGFASSRAEFVSGGFMGSVKHYLSLGGPALLAKVVLSRLFGSSARRTDERGGSQ